jgi:16S rRNA (guanine966-N2)-methyltransferase
VRALDLCAGTGALGIEALSRGAHSVQFVEPQAASAEALRANLARLKAREGAVACTDAMHFLQREASPFGLVFLDPPFAMNMWTPLAQRLEQGGWLAPAAQIYVECPRETTPAVPANWQLHREGQAGEVRYALYRRNALSP